TWHYAFYGSPGDSTLLNLLLVAGMGWLYWLIVAGPWEVYRTAEVRPDGLILDNDHVFWRSYFNVGFPAFPPDADGNLLVSGTYGTRYVEVLTLRRLDENDRTPEVVSTHLAAAIQQLWSRPAR